MNMIRFHKLRPAPKSNILRNITGGFLIGYGGIADVCFFYLQSRWESRAPAAPDYLNGLVFRVDEHGTITYFSAFQATSCALLFSTSIPIAIAGVLIIAKQNLIYKSTRLSFRLKWDKDDPSGVANHGFIIGALAAPALIFLLGPYIIHKLNAMGFVLG